MGNALPTVASNMLTNRNLIDMETWYKASNGKSSVNRSQVFAKRVTYDHSQMGAKVDGSNQPKHGKRFHAE
jgi:hypothetical protein